MTVAEQASAFAAMMLCGAGVGAAHDLLAVCRKNTAWTALADLTLGMIAAMGVIAAGLALRCDPFRLYAILGVAVGWGIYRFTLGTIIRILIRLFMKLSIKVAK